MFAKHGDPTSFILSSEKNLPLHTTFAFTYSNNVYFAEIILQESWYWSGQ